MPNVNCDVIITLFWFAMVLPSNWLLVLILWNLQVTNSIALQTRECAIKLQRSQFSCMKEDNNIFTEIRWEQASRWMFAYMEHLQQRNT